MPDIIGTVIGGIFIWGIIIYGIFKLFNRNKPKLQEGTTPIKVMSTWESIVSKLAIAKKISVWQWLVIIIAIMWAMGYVIQSTPSGKKEVELRTAYSMAQVFVKQKLKSPKSADFPIMSDPSVRVLKKTESGEYFITGYVDSNNPLGVVIRTRYTITMSHNSTNDSWETLTLVFGNN